MNNWTSRAFALLDKCLGSILTEINELDWKLTISNKNERLAQHLSAFANYPNGGFMVFGIEDNGTLNNVQRGDADLIVNKLGNLSRMALEPPIGIQHSILRYREFDILCVFIPESNAKPVYVKNEGLFGSYKRSAKQTVKMSDGEVKSLISTSQGVSFEQKVVKENASPDDVINLLHYDSYFTLSKKNLPNNKSGIMDALYNEGFIQQQQFSGDNWDITNIGAILFARDLRQFGALKRKSIRVIQYSGIDRIDALKEQEGQLGYAIGFEGLIGYIMNLLPQNEIIEKALRNQVKMYPEKSIREFVANALIHQDFYMTGSGVLIEVFSDRIEITNPGTPLVDVNRFIDTAPKSRNEILASQLRRLNICEERGSGIDRAIAAIEAYQLPAPKFIRGDDYTRIIVYAHKPFKDMDKDDRVRACFQHCVLHYVSNQIVNNPSVRRRFNIAEKNYPMATRIINDTIDAGLIKVADPESNSRKFATYVPIWA